MAQISDARTYSRKRRPLHGLFEMLRIPSLSGDPAHAGDVPEWQMAGMHMQSLGLLANRRDGDRGPPGRLWRWLGAGPDKPTIFVYGHYDVVPA